MEFKASPAYIKAIQDRTVTGITAVMGNIDDGGDFGHMGMFAKTIFERKDRIKHLWQHDAWQPPTAVITGLREVGKADLPADLLAKCPEAEGGLEVARDYLDTERGNEILTAIKAGAINEMSYGYDVVRFHFEEMADGPMKGQMIRHLDEVRLWDTSDVNWGMNPATVATMKGIPPHIFDLATLSRAWLDSQSVDALKAGRVLSAANVQRLKDALDVLNELLLSAEPPAEEDPEDAGKALPQETPTEQTLDVDSAKALTEMIERELRLAELELYSYR